MVVDTTRMLEKLFKDMGLRLSLCNTLNEQRATIAQLMQELMNLINAVDAMPLENQAVPTLRYIYYARPFLQWALTQNTLITWHAIRLSGTLPAELRHAIGETLCASSVGFFDRTTQGGAQEEDPLLAQKK
jgi:hypothetical protein